LLGVAIGWNAMSVALAGAAGPAIAAVILSHFSWNWLFVFELPLSALVLLASPALPLVTPGSQPTDHLSIALNFAAFGFLIFGINVAALRPLAAGCMLLASVLAFATLIAREANQSRPLLPLDLLRSASFRNSILASVLCFVGQTAGLIALPFYLQAGLGLSPSIVGLYLTVWPLSVAGTAFVAGRLSRWANSSTLCVLGGVLLALGMFAVAIWPPGNRIVLTPFLVASGIGFGLFQIANNRNLFLAAPLARSGAAGGMQGTARLFGQAGGAALVAQIFMLVPMATAPNLAIGVAAVFALSAGVISVFRPNAP
jgi:DHA2 family multidrug resistance protein-like MFS transporter